MDAIPSHTWDQFWIHEWNPTASRDIGPRVGKWVVTVDADDIDAAWAEIHEALRQNRLGPSAKARTALAHPDVEPNGHLVICVYTHDSRDATDKERVRRALANLGFQKVRYKTDAETRRDWRSCLPEED